ncbi:hypothetical protein [Demequina sp. NBRC 110055]|uniref:hypothetical protein n=1 Tax=Demequina sp. NBRC 110055 TaxID=1570344 RepID=UPI0009FB9C7E|nr:hypothetical protein [Demequina sp. NBRC 110055]
MPAHEPEGRPAVIDGVLGADAVVAFVRDVLPGPVPGRDEAVRIAPVAGERRDPARVSREAPVVAAVRAVVGLALARGVGRALVGAPGRRGELTAPFSPTLAGPGDTAPPRVV